MYIQKRLIGMKKVNARARWEVARGSAESNKVYCTKEGVDIFEKGVTSQQGKRKLDMAEAVKDKLEGMSSADMLEKHGGGIVMYYRKIADYAKTIRDEEFKLKRMGIYKDVDLKDWQKQCIEMVEKQDRRQIHVIVDTNGGIGKTWLTDWFLANKDAVAFENGKSADIKYAYDGQHYIIFDFVKSSQDHINWEIVELLKKGRFLSTKYESKMKCYSRDNKVIIFTNNYPDEEKLTEGRMQVWMYNDDSEALWHYYKR